MKILNCELQKIALAALMLGVFSLSPLAKAGDDDVDGPADDGLVAAQRDGMKLADIRAYAPNFNVRLDGERLVFEGSVPRKCATGSTISPVESTPGVDGKPGRHAIKIEMPNCNGVALTAAEKKDSVQVRSAFPAKGFDNSIDGTFCLLNSDSGDEPKCEALRDSKGPLTFTSANTLLSNAQLELDKKAKIEKKLRDETDLEARTRKELALIEKLKLLCKNGQFKEFGEEVEALKSTLGDVSKYLSQLDVAKKNYYEGAIKKAKADDIKEVYENYLAAAEENGWDTEDMNKAYVERRRDLVNDVVSDAGLSLEKRAGAIREFAAELRESDLYRPNRTTVSWLYGQLASKARDADNLEGAETYFTKAAEEAPDNDTKLKFEQEVAKMFVEAAEACLAKNKAAPGKCDKLAARAKKHMDGAIALQGKKKGEDALDDLNAMKIEKIQMFGMDGFSMNVAGYGAANLRPGSYDLKKQEVYQQGRQEMLMQYQMRMQGMGPGQQTMPGATGLGGTGGSFFR